MTDSPDPDKLKSPGGLTLRQIHEQAQTSLGRDREAQATRSSGTAQRSRWQPMGALRVGPRRTSRARSLSNMHGVKKASVELSLLTADSSSLRATQI